MRYKATIEYDGTNLLGWQRQLDGPSAQEHLETAIAKVLGYENAYTADEKYQSTGEHLELALNQIKDERDFKEINIGGSTEHRSGTYSKVREHPSTGERLELSLKTPRVEVFGAGRTDAGVHALGQVAHFDLEMEMEEWKLREAINAHLRNNNAPVSVLMVEKVEKDFHARFSAIGRGYIYRILNRRAFPVLEKNRVWWVPYPLDTQKMRLGAQYLIGHHDFSSFRASICQAKSPIKTLDKIEIIEGGEEIKFIVEARSFLHHQVRNIIGTLKMVGDGHLEPEDIKRILEAKDRKAAGPTSPACGLYLNKVVY